MHRRTIAALGGAIVALAATALSVPAVGAAPTGSARNVADPGTRPAVACQSNLNPADDTLQSVPAQRFPGSPAVNSQGAMLIKVLAGNSCTVNYLTQIGRLSGSAPNTRVYIQVKADTISGMHKPTGPNLAPGNNNLVPASITTPAGYFNITTNLAAPVTMTAPPTADLRFWVIGQVKITPLVGKWTWEVAVPDPANDSDVWRNPGGAVGCGTAWKPVSIACLGSAPGKGLMGEVGT